MQTREKGRKRAKHCVFPMICGSGESKSTLAEAAGAEPVGRWEMKNGTPLWRDYTTLHYTTRHDTTRHTTHYTLHHATPQHTQLHYTTLPYPTLRYITLHCITLHWFITPPQMQLQLHYANYTTPQLQLHYTTTTTTAALQLQRQGHGVGSFWVLLGCQVQTCKPIKSNESMSNLKSAVFTSFQSASNPSNLSGNLSHPFATPGSESWGQSHWLRPEDFRPVCQTPESIKTVWKEPRAETRSHYWWRQTHLSPEISIYIHTWCIFPDYAWLKLGIAVLPFEEPGGWGREVKPIINPETGDSFFF